MKIDRQNFFPHEKCKNECVKNVCTCTETEYIECISDCPKSDCCCITPKCPICPPGPPGPPGRMGPPGRVGPPGPVGPVGPMGPQGPAGIEGPAGPEGPEGIQGIQGVQGIQGEIGPEGPQGIQGETGPEGPQGIQGETGPQGPAGTNGLSEYAHIYNLDAQVVAVEGDVLFSTNGVMVGTFTHAPGTSTIEIGSAGNFAVWFNVAGVEPCQFCLLQNGAPVPGAIYGSGAGTQPNPGMLIISAVAGDNLTLRNHTSAAAVTLQTLAGGTQINANASVMILKLSP